MLTHASRCSAGLSHWGRIWNLHTSSGMISMDSHSPAMVYNNPHNRFNLRRDRRGGSPTTCPFEKQQRCQPGPRRKGTQPTRLSHFKLVGHLSTGSTAPPSRHRCTLRRSWAGRKSRSLSSGRVTSTLCISFIKIRNSWSSLGELSASPLKSWTWSRSAPGDQAQGRPADAGRTDRRALQASRPWIMFGYP